ncbi:MAG TPA: divalent metal cation transporter [Blastocatellia bacterium]|nr:divalent metal cation transporter [Blastocatellia bacterium]
MRKLLEITLGIVTSIGGFLEIGSLSTAAQAGAAFGLQLIWAIVLGGLCIIFLVEMSGRFAAVSKHTIPDAMRERFGFNFFIVPLITINLVNFLVLAAEIGGICISLEYITGINFKWWPLPVAFLIWLLLWKGTFGFIENGISFLGLVTVIFIIAAVSLHPSYHDIAAAVIPSLPQRNEPGYWFIAVSILGASITPYLMYFYSSGAIEDKWDKSDLGMNKVVAGLGMSFGSIISIAILILAAFIFQPIGIQADQYQQLPLLLTKIYGYWGLILFAASLGIACLGASLEVSLETAYMMAQGFGWNWGKNVHPKEAARFSLTYTIVIPLAALLIVAGINPLKLTIFSMALTSATLPIAVVPFLLLMNDKNYVGDYKNGCFSNAVVLFIIGMAFVLAVVSIPLEIAGG